MKDWENEPESARLKNIIAALKKPGKDPAHYALDHSSFVYLVDRAGSLRALSPYGSSADDIAHDVAILLKK